MKFKAGSNPIENMRFQHFSSGALKVSKGAQAFCPFGLVWAKRHDVCGRRPSTKLIFGQKCFRKVLWLN